MSRAEQEPSQEQATVRSGEGFSLIPAVPAEHSLTGDRTEVLQLATMETDTMATTSVANRHPHGDYGNTQMVNNRPTFNEDYLELIGEHRKSPIFV